MLNSEFQSPIGILDRVYQNVIVQKIDTETNEVTSFTHHNRILPQFVAMMFANMLNPVYSFNNINIPSLSQLPFSNTNPYYAIGLQYGASGVIVSGSVAYVNIPDPYPSLTNQWPGSMSAPLIISQTSYYDYTDNYYRSAINGSIQYALVNSVTSITIGTYPYANGISYQFTLTPNDLIPIITQGNNPNYVVNTNNGPYTVFNEISLVMIPYSVFSSATSWQTASNIIQYPIIAHILFDIPLFKGQNIIYNFTWNIWVNY